MAVVTRPHGEFHYVRNNVCRVATSQNGRTSRSLWDFIKTQICTIAVSLSLFNSVRLPREAFKYGPVPYLVVYSFWLLAAGLPTALLQLSMGQLSQQDPVGVWRAVPIFRGIGHLKVFTSYLCCTYYMIYLALSAAFVIWIAKGSFPLKECAKLHMTPNGYENKMNATECFSSTFLAPFTEFARYIAIMAILIFILWFFIPILLLSLRKSLKISLCILMPVIITIGITMSAFLADGAVLESMYASCEEWLPLYEPYIWQSALVQALLSTQIASGYLISAGGSVYKDADVRWSSASIIMCNFFAGWLWVLMWESIGGKDKKDINFVAVLVLIYQSSVSEGRGKEWPLLGFGIVFVSGIVTVLTLLFPVFDRLHHITVDNWRLYAGTLSAVGTVATVVILAQGINVAVILEDLAVPVLVLFTTAVEVAGFLFIYGWRYLAVDIEFLTGTKFPCFLISPWWSIPVMLVGVTGWWLRALLRATWDQGQTLWPLVGVFIGILVVMVIVAAIAVAKEEQYNLLSKISAAFHPSRLWGPEEPGARYIWMSQRYVNEMLSSDKEDTSDTKKYASIIFDKHNENKYNDSWNNDTELYQSNYEHCTKNGFLNDLNKVYGNREKVYPTHSIPRSKKKDEDDDKFRSPNICIAKGKLGGPINCSCNRHFTLNVPDMRNNEATTSL